ncbi:PsbP-related protein [Paenibacillus kandeliae]|uniref:PsbP-related protein n=1 Tax=Paenibacillus kandeliae TaxID=3231269 RepID=UPI00345A2D65
MFKKVVPVIALSLALSACGSNASDTSSQTKEASKPAEVSSTTTTTTETTVETVPAAEETTSTSTDTASDVSATEGYTTYQNDLFSFDYPSNWSKYDMSSMNMPALQVAFANSQPKVAFGDNVNVTIEDVTDPSTTIQSVSKNLIAYYKQNTAGMPNFKLIDYVEDSGEGKAGQAGILLGQYTHPDSGLTIVLGQFLGYAHDKMYTLTVSMSEDAYNDGGKAEMAHMLQSFHVN